MGDLSEYRGIIVVISFVGMAILIVGMMIAQSPDLFASTTSGDTTLPENINPITLLAWNSTTNSTVPIEGNNTEV